MRAAPAGTPRSLAQRSTRRTRSRAGDSVQVAGGTYPLQRITQKPGKDTEGDAPDVTFAPAPGATVKVAGLELGALCMCDDPSQFTGPDHITIKNMADARNPQGEWRAGQDTNDVTWENIDAANFYIEGVRDFRVQGGDWGPCYVNQGPPCSNSKITFTPSYPTERVTVDGATFHDYRIANGSATHFECMFIVGGRDVTVRKSKFYGCEFFDIFVQYFNDLSYPRLGYNPLSGLTIENNWFAQPYDGRGSLRETPVWFWTGGTTGSRTYSCATTRSTAATSACAATAVVTARTVAFRFACRTSALSGTSSPPPGRGVKPV